MLIHIKNRQQKIASVTLTIFLGSWLLFLCQACIAFTVSPANHQAINEINKEAKEACHDKDIPFYIEETSSELNNADTQHCLGVCDCDAIATTLNSDKSPDITAKIKLLPDLHVFVEPQIRISNQLTSAYRISPPPERAIFLPQQHYTVLLN